MSEPWLKDMRDRAVATAVADLRRIQDRSDHLHYARMKSANPQTNNHAMKNITTIQESAISDVLRRAKYDMSEALENISRLRQNLALLELALAGAGCSPGGSTHPQPHPGGDQGPSQGGSGPSEAQPETALPPESSP